MTALARRSRSITASCLGLALGLALALSARDARAEDPTKEQCISANEDAQSLRSGGHLQAARTQLLICVRTSCPPVIRDDCSQRLNDIENAIPTIVFTAKGTADVDISEVKVVMDGVTIASRLDGAALTLEPGEHSFEFRTPGYAPVVKSLVLREGVKRRQEQIVFIAIGGAAPPPGAVVQPVVVPQPPPEQPPPSSSSGDSRRLVAYALGGAGIVGIGLGAFFGLKAKSTYDDGDAHCPRGPASCDAQGVSSGSDASSQATASTIAFIAGGALLASGIVVFVTAPKSGATTGLSVSPSVASNGGGLRLNAAW